MDKVKLPLVVAEALNEFLADGHSHQIIMTAVIAIGAGPSSHLDETLVLKRYSAEGGFTNIMQALVNGYEVEQTPEDEVLEMYARLDFSYEPEKSIGKAIVRTLDILNIKIEGVNA
jgi:hypothetical protein